MGIEKEIELLQREYIKALSEKCNILKRLVTIESDELQKFCHKIAGSAGTYGIQTLTHCTRYVEDELLSGQCNFMTTSARSLWLMQWLSYFNSTCTAYQQLLDANLNTTEKWSAALKRVDQALLKQWQREHESLKCLTQRAA